MEVTILGAGDTTGTPTPGCHCDTCDAARDQGIERSRFSVLVEGPTGALLVDASPDFRHQLLRNPVPVPDAAIVTHVHFDHLDGLGNAYRLVDALPVHAANETDPETGESVAETVARRYDYLDRVTVTGQSPHEPFRVCGLDCTLVPVDHPPLKCYGVTIDDPETGGRLAITGDTAYGLPDRSRERLSEADLMLADGLVPPAACHRHPKGGRHVESGVPRTFGTKHMTRAGALALADECDADRVRLVHVSHFYDADEAFEDPLAVDGEQFTV